MPTNEQRRQAAKRKLERQLARRAERAKRRRVVGVVVTVVVVLGAVGLVYWLANLGDGDQQAAAENTASSTPEAPPAKTSSGPCKYTETPAEPSPKPAGLPEDPEQTSSTGTVKVKLATSQGEIPLTLDRAKAPCTVQSIEHLVKQKFFDSTKCHRLTASDGLKVLQCGDPTGTGSGGPGYTIKDEPPTGLPSNPDGSALYARGTLAMANTGQPNSGGSQFFMVYADTKLPPNYAVFGMVDEAGLATLDKIAAGGIEPSRSPEDGAPKLPVDITQAVVTS